jgi:nucleotide-binding universal stress UspA family protein
MKTIETTPRISLENILYLTDFSEPSEAALPFAISIAREYGSKLYALHILTPAMYTYTSPKITVEAINAQEKCAEQDMTRLEPHFRGLKHEAIIERGVGFWQTLESALKRYRIDMIVLGTHGRTGAAKLALGSVAEEVFRRSHVPVLTIGPSVPQGFEKGARFHRVLFATDFSRESMAAAPYAISLAQENDAQLFLLHVLPVAGSEREAKKPEASVVQAVHKLAELVPSEAELWCRPEPMVECGEPAEKILGVAQQRDADLIVLGVRGARLMGAATHLEGSTAHKMVAHAKCPVLTVRN